MPVSILGVIGCRNAAFDGDPRARRGTRQWSWLVRPPDLALDPHLFGCERVAHARLRAGFEDRLCADVTITVTLRGFPGSALPAVEKLFVVNFLWLYYRPSRDIG